MLCQVAILPVHHSSQELERSHMVYSTILIVLRAKGVFEDGDKVTVLRRFQFHAE